MFQVKQSEATAARRRIPILFVSSTDGFTPVTPTSPAAYISVNGATWVATTNAVAVATLAAGQSLAGVYYLELTAAEVANLGWITVNVQATNARQYNAQIQVMAYDPYDVVRIGLTSIPNVAQGNAGALPTGSATGQVTVATNNDKTGYSLTQAFPTNFASMAITAGGAVTAGTVSDKTGYSLTQAFPTNFSALAITAGGAVTAGTVNDKTGYSLATAPPTAAAIATQVWSEALPGTYTSGQAGFKLNAAGSAADPWSTTLPGAYAAGSAGNIIGNRLDAAVSSRMATFTLPTNFSTLAISGTGAVTAGTVSDKTGYSLATAPPTAAAIATQVWSEALPGAYTSGQAGFKLDAGTATNVWGAGTRTLTAGTNIVLAKGTGITGFNDITAQSVWDVLASSVSLTNSIGLQLKTNIDATVSSRLSSAGYTVPPTAATISSTVWGDTVASYSNTASFGYRLLRSDSTTHSGDVQVNGNGSANNHNRIDSDIHAIASDTTAATNLKNLLPVAGKVAGTVTGIENITFPTNFNILAIQNTTGYVTATNGGGGGGGGSASPSIGPYTVLPSGAGADNIVDLNVGSALPLVLNLQDGSGAPFNASGATITATVYTAGGSTVTTYTGSIIAGYIGAISVPLSTAVTATSATYTMLVSVVIGTTTTVFGPLKLVVRAI